MTLPPSGKTVWPPAHCTTPHADMDVWHAWYSGDVAHLTQVYGGPASMVQNPAARSFFDLDKLNRPSQYRGGVVGGLARMFWGQPIAPGQQASKLHIPTAGDIAELSANLLWSEVPEVTADGDSTDAADTTSAQIKRYLDDRGHSTMREASEIGAAMGGVYLRVVWDTDLRPRPWLDVIYPDAAVPEWKWGELSAVTVWRVLDSPSGGSQVWRLLERHEPGSIEYGLYCGDANTLGMSMGLADHPDSADLATRVNADGIQETGVPRMLVTYVPNVGPNRLWRGIPEAVPLGRSDYAGIEPLMDALDEAWTSWMRDLRLGKARIMVPQSMLETDGPGSGALLDLDREVFVSLNGMLDDGAGAGSITENQFAIRVDEHERTCTALRRQILSSAGYSAQSFGEEGSVAVTATEVAARKEESLTTRGVKILYQRPALLAIMTTMLWVDAVHCGAKGIDPAAELTASWPQAVQPDPEATARTLSLLETAGAISTWMKVKAREPEWDDAQVAEEVRRIREDSTMTVPAGDPFGTGGGQLEDPQNADGTNQDAIGGAGPADTTQGDAKAADQGAVPAGA